MNWEKLGITNTSHFFFGFVRSIIGLCNISPENKKFKLEHGLPLTTRSWFGNDFPQDTTRELSLYFVEDIELARKMYLEVFEKESFVLIFRDENKGYLLAQQLKEKYIKQYQEIFSVFEGDYEMFPARFSWRLHMEKAIKRSERFVNGLNKEQKAEVKNFLLSFVDIKKESKKDFLNRFWPGYRYAGLHKLFDNERMLQYIRNNYKVWPDGHLESEAEQYFRRKRNWEDGQGVFDF